MSAAPTTTVTLRALEGAPLADEAVRGMVVATAHAIAERQGVRVRRVTPADDRIEVTLDVGRLEAIAFAAELRRLTTAWYRSKYGERTLWGEPRPHDARQGDGQEQAGDDDDDADDLDADWWKAP